MLQEILVAIHAYLRWILLFCFFILIGIAIKKKKNALLYAKDKKILVATMILLHSQLLIGFILYAISSKVVFAGGIMQNPVLRFYTVEHAIGMLIAGVVFTIGKRKITDPNNILPYRSLLIFTLTTLFIIIASIPWPFRGLGAGWV